jgi:hypothetical protein
MSELTQLGGLRPPLQAAESLQLVDFMDVASDAWHGSGLFPGARGGFRPVSRDFQAASGDF